MGLRLPVLRSPAFPGVGRDQAAVSRLRPAVAIEPAAAIDPERVRALIAAIVHARVGGAFWEQPARIDGTPDTILCPRDGEQAGRMADAARVDNPTGNLLVVLPAAAWTAAALRRLSERGIATMVGAVDPWSLIAAAPILHVDGDDELAFLAIIAGRQVRCHGHGLFAGHGLAAENPASTEEKATSIESLAAAVLIHQASYRDPFTGAATEIEDAIDRLRFWRATLEANRGVAAAAGIASWKRREVEGMLHPGGDRPLRFCPNAATAVQAAVADGGGIAVWPSRAPAGLAEAAAAAEVPVFRVEDGFVRSVGLGAACHPPLSIVLDRTGLYYDPTGPSDLETILATAEFPAELTKRAAALAEFIVRAGISKYATGRGAVADLPSGVRRVLVTGQVEDDLSVRLAGGDVAGNLDLLRRVRAAEPDAFIVFKPHPDVEAGLRPGHVSESDALRFADRVERSAGMPELLDAVDCVHVLTSLAGFEALLRGREVVAHGQPFYAGWGLTRDLAGPLPRRTRRLTLTELVAGALILYPRYLDPVTRLPCPPEVLMARLSEQSRPRSTWLTRIRDMQGRLRRSSRRARSAA
jgi:capsular polysaccharide export protein